MKKTKLFITSILIAILLSACNTSEVSNSGQNSNSADKTDISDTVNNTDINGTTENIETNSTTIENSTQQNSANSSTMPDEGKFLEQGATLSYTIGEQKIEKPYELTQSTQQDYSIQLTDQFYLLEEEPGKDIVFFKENEAIMMRIEVLSELNWTYENALENSKAFMTASSKDNSYTTFKLPSNVNTKNFNQYDSYIVENESDKVVLLLISLDDKLIRLTIFDDYITNVTEAFLIQGATIQ